MKRTQNKSRIVQILTLTLAAFLFIALIASLVVLLRPQSYTVNTAEYKDLQRFAYWADADGKKVSEENPYTYEARSEHDLIAVYEEFLRYDLTYGDSSAEDFVYTQYDAQTHTLSDCFWFNTAVLTTPLRYGMTIEFTVRESAKQVLFGVSENNVVDNVSANTWNPNFPYLFIPSYNVYVGTEYETREPLAYLYPLSSGAVGGKEYLTNFSATFPYVSGSDELVTVRLVLDDTLLVYIDGVLLAADNLPAYSIAREKDYYFSFAACITDMQITDFGYDQYISVRGKLDESNLTNEIVTEDTFYGKKAAFLGDSITEGVGVSDQQHRYSSVLCNSLGMTEINLGVSGTVYCTGHSNRASRISDVAKIPYDSDVVIVLLGINDFDQAIVGKFAELGEFGSTDTSTVYGAADAMYRALVNRFRCTDARIYICTPVITSWNNSVSAERDWSQDKKNACGYTLPDLCSALKEVAQYYGLVCYDLNAFSGVTQADFADGIHPNESGAAKIADSLEGFLLQNVYYEFQ